MYNKFFVSQQKNKEKKEITSKGLFLLNFSKGPPAYRSGCWMWWCVCRRPCTCLRMRHRDESGCRPINNLNEGDREAGDRLGHQRLYNIHSATHLRGQIFENESKNK